MSYQAPPWQAPPRRTGWNDPRLSQSQQTPTPGQQQQPYQQSASAQSPISPINPQAFAYHPPDTQQPSYGAPSGFAGQYDTSTWGVKYNQTQSQPPPPWQPAEERPPLPPRPSSALQTTQPQQTTSHAQWQQGPDSQAAGPQAQHQHQQQPSWSQSYGQPPVYGQAVPPPPPPKPPVYEVQTQQQSYQQPSQHHDAYSHQPATHHYDPQRPSGQHPYSAPQPQYSLHASSGPLQDVAPVSPIEPEPQRWPSQQPIYGNHQPSVMQAPATPGEDKFYSTALGPYGGPSDWEHFGDGTTVSPEVSSPPRSHATPAFVVPQVSASPPPMVPPSSEPAPVVEPSRPTLNHQSSETSSVSTGVKRSDTIDGVINAWSAPLKFAPKQDRIDESRPQSKGSIHESPKERIVEVVKEVTKVVDPYEDMEPEFKASLKRYADMLRKESAAETDEQKFAAFEAFIKKELRLRAMLYGMDSPLQLIKTQLRNTQSGDKPKEASHPASPAPASVVAPTEPIKEPSAPANSESVAPPPVAAPAPEAQTIKEPVPPRPEPTKKESGPDTASPPTSVTTGLNLAALAAQLRDSPVQSSSGNRDGFDKVKAADIPGTVDADDDDDQQFSPGGRPLPKSNPNVTSSGPEEAYSPGGRPIPITASRPAKAPIPELTIPTLPPARPNILSPGANAPMVLEDYAMPGQPSLPSPGANAPMLVEPSPQSASANAPQVVSPGMHSSTTSAMASKRSSTASSSVKKFEPPRPAYTPFRYAPAVQGPRMPADKSYSSLRKDGLESGRFLKHDPSAAGNSSSSSATPARVATPAAAASSSGLVPIAPLQHGGGAGGKRMQDEAFIGLIRMQSKAVRKGGAKPRGGSPPPAMPGLPIAALRPGTPAVQRAGTPGAGAGAATGGAVGGGGGGGVNPTARTPTPAAMATGRAATPAAPRDLKGAVAALRASLPESVPDSYGAASLSRHDGVNAVKSKVDGYVDQFGFIHGTVVEWDRRNRVLRQRLDEERSQREKDSEARIDDMFNDNEIGYADIGELEGEFKYEEAKRKYEEDKGELDSFTREVFDVVNEKLRGEVEGLAREYERVVELLDERCEAAGRCLEGGSGGEVVPEMGIVMNLVLAIFNKMELRHQKLTEAAVERERRRKKLELTVLYTNGDTAGVKKLESEFAVAEKMQVLHEARARDVRANRLMDAFDRATVRGLGDNQEFVDQLLPRIRQVRELVMQENGEKQENEVLYGPQGVRETLALAQKAVDFVLADSQKLLTIENVADKVLNEADYGVSVAEARVSDADRGTYQKLGEEKEKEDAKIVEDTGARMGAVGKAPEEAVELIREVVARIGDDPEHQARIMRALEAARKRNEGGG